MPNITLSVDADVLNAARKAAANRGTTLTALVRQFIDSIAASDKSERERRVDALQMSFARLTRDMGERTWTRNEVHGR